VKRRSVPKVEAALSQFRTYIYTSKPVSVERVLTKDTKVNGVGATKSSTGPTNAGGRILARQSHGRQAGIGRAADSAAYTYCARVQ
jgi:hypothetical protein